MFTYTKTAVLLILVLALSGFAGDPPAQKKDDLFKSVEIIKHPGDFADQPIKMRSRLLDEISDDLQILKQKLQLPEDKDPGEPGKQDKDKQEAKKLEAARQAADEQLLKNAGIKAEPEDLLEFFRKRTLKEVDRSGFEAAIRQLGSGAYRDREEAMKLLLSKGPQTLELLRQAMRDSDPEISGRAERCFNRIRDEDVGAEATAAAARQLGRLKSGGAVEVLFAYLPSAQVIGVIDEVRDVLAGLAAPDGKTHHPVLVKGLQDASPWRRAVAAEVLTKVKADEHKKAVHKLLKDRDVQVRLRVARCLTFSGDAAGPPALIEALPQLTCNQAWQVDEVLFRLAEGKNPPMVSVGRDEQTRKKSQAAWAAWWQKEGKNADLSRLKETPALLGHTMVVLLDERRVVDLDKDNVPVWSIENLELPLDAQILTGDRLLVAEYNGQRVTERNLKGEILWEKKIGAPLVAQRLSNGHTFIASDSQFVEYDREDKEVVSIRLETGERIMKALKLPGNEICCLVAPADAFNQFGPATSRVVRLDATGKELSSIDVELGMRLFGGRIHMLANGNVLVPHNGENRVVEYNSQGKMVWQVSVPQPIAAFRLASGNTLVTSMDTFRGAAEFTPGGQQVWNFRAATRVTRAMRR